MGNTEVLLLVLIGISLINTVMLLMVLYLVMTSRILSDRS